MRVCLVMLEEPFYLPRHLGALLDNHHRNVSLIALVPARLPRESFGDYFGRLMAMYGPLAFGRQALRFASLGVRNTLRRVRRHPTGGSLGHIAETHGIPTVRVPDVNSVDFRECLVTHRVDLLASVACPQVFQKPLLDYPRRGCINVHGALLPDYRGVFSAFWVLFHEEKFTGATVHYMTAGIDDGPVIARERIPIGPGDTVDRLCRKTAKLGMTLLDRSLARIQSDTVVPTPQHAAEGRYHSYPTRTDRKQFLQNGHRYF